VAVEDMVAAVMAAEEVMAVVVSTAAEVSMVEAPTSEDFMAAVAISADLAVEDFVAAALMPFTARRGRDTVSARVIPKLLPRESIPPKPAPLKSAPRQIEMHAFRKAQSRAGTGRQAVRFSATQTP
jgi:hypothetical protein